MSSAVLSDKSQFPFFYRMFTKLGFHYPRIVQLLLHFKWILIGLFASDTEMGDHFMRTFTPMLVRNGICVVISQQFSVIGGTKPIGNVLSIWRQVNAFVHFMEYVPLLDRIIPHHLIIECFLGCIKGKVWIITVSGEYQMGRHNFFKYIHSLLTFNFQGGRKPRDYDFNPHLYVEHELKYKTFKCSFSKHVFSVKGRRRCIQEAPLETQKKMNRIYIRHEHHVFALIKTLAHILNAAYSSKSRRRRRESKGSLRAQMLQPWQVWGYNRDLSNLVLFEKESKGEMGEPSYPPCATKRQQVWLI